jgi:16S rRNA (cytidine1402-2'-O)-methyltransferase
MDKQENLGEGWLAIVATPIGNLEDITLRALRILKEADVIAAEDTRHAARLCQHFEITTRRVSYHIHNEHHKTGALLDQVEAGQKIALLSDAGTPVISDPGFLIVREAIARGIEPLVIPGVSALTFAVVAAGFPADHFTFVGFPPVKQGRRRTFLEHLVQRDTTTFIYESPHRITKLLGNLVEIFGPQTQVALIREATKMYEECLRGSAAELLEKHGDRKWRGEFVVAVNLRGAEVVTTEDEKQ